MKILLREFLNRLHHHIDYLYLRFELIFSKDFLIIKILLLRKMLIYKLNIFR